MKKTNKAFTLVELIVVITILIILAAIGFVSFSGYLAGARDGNRIAQLKSMSDALELYTTKKDLPDPDNKLIITHSGTEIAYQGYLGADVIEAIGYNETGLDPKDKNYFSYYVTSDKKCFELMSLLEEPNSDVLSGTTIEPQDRYGFTKGAKLGILTDKYNNPIQETKTGTLDIKDVGNLELIAHMRGGDTITGSGTKFAPLKTFSENCGQFCASDNLTCTQGGGSLASNTYSCTTKPTYTNIDTNSFVDGTPTSLGQSRQNTNSSNPCYFSCNTGYSGSDCSIAPVATCSDGTFLSQYLCADTDDNNRFTDLGNGIIKDNTTLLEWQQDGITQGRKNWLDSKTYCANLTLGSKNDWRLPDITELNSIVNFNKFNLAINSIFTINGPTISYTSSYWTSTTSDYLPTNAYLIFFEDGSSGGQSKNIEFYVRCVR